MSLKNIMIANKGALGRQIAFQTAFSGFNVFLYEPNKTEIELAKNYLKILKTCYISDLNTTQNQVDNAYDNITFINSIDGKIKDTDFIIESLSEDTDIKHSFYKEIDQKVNKHTIVATTSSNFLSNQIFNTINYQNKFLALSFLNELRVRNIVEVIYTSDIDKTVLEEVFQFLESIKMVKVPIHQNNTSSILNSLLTSFIDASGYLLGNCISDFITIDKTWMKATGDLQGPFGLQDILGINTSLDILKYKNETSQENREQNYINIIKTMTNEGKLGKLKGQGFYTYPSPLFEQNDFFDAPKYIQALTHGFKNITIAGGGVLGSQIAFQVAAGNFNVSLYDISESALNQARKRIEKIKIQYEKDMGVSKNKVNTLEHNITYYSSLHEATSNSDLIIEVVPENHKIKEKFYKQLAQVCPEKAYIVTNSSTLRPSDFEEFTGRPKKFAALHFANHVWVNNTGEVMVASQTSEETFNKILAFARDINLTVLPIRKEQPGYILNTLLVPLLTSAQRLLASNTANFEMIDKVWMIATQSKKGPFAIIDIVGLNTAYNIACDLYKKTQNPIDKKIIEILKEKVNNNELGVAVGKGFYDYTKGVPYETKDFLS